ncbi:MAG: tetratricopeptide repeat protein [Byssovorax sp.]
MNGRISLLPLLLLVGLYAALAALLGGFIIDDAGISFAYARNLGMGHGLVAQPGLPPVEGFSNLLWVLILAPLFRLHLFHPVLVPKLLGAALVAFSLVTIRRLARQANGSEGAALLAAGLVAMAPPIVIWSTSGLENGLSLALAVATWAALAEQPPRWGLRVGALAVLLAMTRPDGLLLGIGAVGIALVLSRRSRAGLREALFAAVVLGGGFVALLTFRMRTFGLAWPHPYYAKRIHAGFGETLSAFASNPKEIVLKLDEVSRGAAGPLGPLVLGATLVAAIHLAVRRRLPRALGVSLGLQATALAAYVWIDRDWMGEHRFGTVAVALSLADAVMLGSLVLAEVRPRVRVACALGLAAALGAGFVPRIARFAASPPTPMADVMRTEALRFEAYADALAIEQPSVLLADVGAPLYRSRMRVFDAAGLCEPAVVRTLKQGTQYWLADHPRYYDWVLDEVKPTFITSRGFWSFVAQMDRDPRFLRDYAAIDAHADAYARRALGAEVRSGTWVRRSALRSPGDLDRLRAAYAPPPREAPWAARALDRLDRWLGRDAPRGDRALIEAKQAEVDGAPDRAVDLLEQALGAEPDRPALICALGAALDEAGRTFEARPRWVACLARAEAQGLAAEAAGARARLGDDAAERRAARMEEGVEAMYRRGDAAAAAVIFTEVLAEVPDHYGATYQLAVALDRQGKREEARARWEKVLSMATALKDEPTRKTAEERLR